MSEEPVFPVPRPPVSTERPGGSFLVRGLLYGAAMGAFVGLLDASRALASPNELVQPKDALAVVVFYALWFAPLGFLAAVFARWFAWPWRMLHLVVVMGGMLFFVAAWLNVAALPGFTSALALFVDILLLAAAVAIVRVRYRADGEDAPFTSRWTLLALASLGIAFLFGVTMDGRGDGDAPKIAKPAGTRPNVLLVLVDTLRADRLGCYGYKKPTSAELDAFAADATVFTDCRAVTSWTKPSVASLFTSMYPSAHACREQREVLVPEAETMAELFRAGGWRTAAFVDNPFVSPEFGFGQGFEEFEGVRPSVVVSGTLLGKGLFMTRVLSLVGRPFGVGEREDAGSPELHEQLLAFAAKTRDPWFAYVHAMEPHLPYTPEKKDAEALGFPAGEEYEEPPRYNGILPFQTTEKPDAKLLAKLTAQYDGEVRGWSRAFGALVAEMKKRGLLENTVVVVLSDHGEEFCEHGGWTHGHSLHREVTQVPLVVRLPDALGPAAKASRGRRVGGVATLLDVLPTLEDLCGIQDRRLSDPRRSGKSLAPELLPAADGKPPREFVPERTILGEVTMTPVGLRAIREGRWQLIRSEEPMNSARELYDDVSDAAHARDKMKDQIPEAQQMEARMDDLFRRLAAIALSGGSRDIDPQTADALKKLGYLGGK